MSAVLENPTRARPTAFQPAAVPDGVRILPQSGWTVAEIQGVDLAKPLPLAHFKAIEEALPPSCSATNTSSSAHRPSSATGAATTGA